MESLSLWKQAAPPNYTLNVDKYFPYSETIYLGEYNLVKIPLPDETIEHVDYWGEGKVQGKNGAKGFSDAYNVNLTFKLVSEGPDKNKKIPNRIPVHSYTNSDTSAYVKDNSVQLVTLDSSDLTHVTHSCIGDIARIVNKDQGRVILFGFSYDSKTASDFAATLKNKKIYPCPVYTLPSELQGTQFDKYVAFLNVEALKTELSNFITSASYNNAVTLTKTLVNDKQLEAIRQVVVSLLADVNNGRKVLAYGYQLWQNNSKDVVRNQFPSELKSIIAGETVMIINGQYSQALKMDAQTDSYGDRLIWGDSNDRSSKRMGWQFIPFWENNAVTFKIYNANYNMYLKLDATTDDAGDRKGWGSTGSSEDRHKFFLEPFKSGNSVHFFIINFKYSQSLKLDVTADDAGDRLVWGNNGQDYKGEERFKWTVTNL